MHQSRARSATNSDRGQASRSEDRRIEMRMETMHVSWRTRLSTGAASSSSEEDLPDLPGLSRAVSCLPHTSNVRIFAGSERFGDEAEEWLEQFQLYCNSNNIDESSQLEVFKLLLADHEHQWLNSLPRDKKEDIQTLIGEFRKRHALTGIDKWTQICTDLLFRQQEADESDDDYFAAQQSLAKRIGADQSLLRAVIIQGLKRQLEAALTSQINLTTSLKQLVTVMSAICDEAANSQPSATKEVMFADQDRRGRQHQRRPSPTPRSMSPVDRRSADRRVRSSSYCSPARPRFNNNTRRSTPPAGRGGFSGGDYGAEKSSWRWQQRRCSSTFATAQPRTDCGTRYSNRSSRSNNASHQLNGERCFAEHSTLSCCRHLAVLWL
jgi:hypothetical protein